MTEQKRLSETELKELLQRLAKWDALEFHEDAERGEILIPYVMNDAAECYMRLTGASMRGEPDEEQTENGFWELVHGEALTGLIFRQISGNTFTIWFEEAFWTADCYQYHLIGHGWRQEKGQEYIRRLVNLVCVIHDKKTYLGPEYCSETEFWISALAEFAPVLYFTPINESVLDWYPHSPEGIEAARRLAEEAGDISLLKALERYEKLFRKVKIRMEQVENTAGLLMEKAHAGFWRLLEEKIRLADSTYGPRDYGEKERLRIEEIRRQLTDKYRQQGFAGEYPRLLRQNEDGGVDREIIFAEEQPFCIMESDDFKYRIFSMEMDPESAADCEWKEEIAIKWN